MSSKSIAQHSLEDFGRYDEEGEEVVSSLVQVRLGRECR